MIDDHIINVNIVKYTNNVNILMVFMMEIALFALETWNMKSCRKKYDIYKYEFRRVSRKMRNIYQY